MLSSETKYVLASIEGNTLWVSRGTISGREELRKFQRNSSLGLFPEPDQTQFPKFIHRKYQLTTLRARAVSLLTRWWIHNAQATSEQNVSGVPFSVSRALDKYIYENISLYDKAMARGGPECLYNVPKTYESGRPEADTTRVAKLTFMLWQFQITYTVYIYIYIYIYTHTHTHTHTHTVAVFVILLLQNVHEKLLPCQRTTFIQTCIFLILNEIVQY